MNSVVLVCDLSALHDTGPRIVEAVRHQAILIDLFWCLNDSGRYQVSQRKRKRIEEVFGWLKTVGMLRKTRHRGIFKVGWVFTFAAAA